MTLGKIAERVDEVRTKTRGRFGILIDLLLLGTMIAGFFVNPAIMWRLSAIESQLEQLVVIRVNVAALCRSTPDAHCVDSLDAHARVEVPQDDHSESSASR